MDRCRHLLAHLVAEFTKGLGIICLLTFTVPFLDPAIGQDDMGGRFRRLETLCDLARGFSNIMAK